MCLSKWFPFSLVVGFLLIQPSGAFAQQSRPDDEITRLTDDVHLFRHKFHQSIFITTPKGVIVTDPISSDAATWLKAKIKTLTDQPVRYVIYSHHHKITSPEAASSPTRRSSSVKLGRETEDSPSSGSQTPVPDLTFTDRMFIDLGGKHVELIYTGRNHSDSSLVVLLPQNQLLFAVDFIPVETVAYRTLRNDYPDEWIELSQTGRRSGVRHRWCRDTGRSARGNMSATVSRISPRSQSRRAGTSTERRERRRGEKERSASQVRTVGSAMPTGFRRMSKGCTAISPSSGREISELLCWPLFWGDKPI